MGEARKSVASASRTHYCQYFELMLLLKDSISNRPTISNVVLPVHLNENSSGIVENDHDIATKFMLLKPYQCHNQKAVQK